MVEQLPYAADLGHVDFAKFGLEGWMLAGFLYDPVDLFLREIGGTKFSLFHRRIDSYTEIPKLLLLFTCELDHSRWDRCLLVSDIIRRFHIIELSLQEFHSSLSEVPTSERG